MASTSPTVSFAPPAALLVPWVLLLAGSVAAQLDWVERLPPTGPGARTEHAIAFDSARGRLLLYGGVDSGGYTRGDTWEWDGRDWIERHPLNQPGTRRLHAMAYDPTRRRTVLFGGTGTGTGTGATWEWDGNDWIFVAPQGIPQGRIGQVLAYDPAGSRVILFGGVYTTAPLADTWAWDGTRWTQLNPATQPPGRWQSGAAADLARGRIVMYGGFADLATRMPLGDTWEWTGRDWVQRMTSLDPPPQARGSLALAYDAARARTVMLGGVGQRFPGYAEVWEWNGNGWRMIPTSFQPYPRTKHSLAYDSVRARVVLFGGLTYSPLSFKAVDEVATWDGSSWMDVTTTRTPSGWSFVRQMAHDPVRGRIVIVAGGLPAFNVPATWEWDGRVWWQRPEVGTPGTYPSAMTYDAGRSVIVLVNGYPVMQTWEYDGTIWQRRTVASEPPARQGHAITYDAARQRVLLFGGLDTARQPLDDTWEWDGVTWSRGMPATRPPARHLHALAYDGERERVVLFGGADSSTYGTTFGDTWEWDGASWQRVVTWYQPTARHDHGMAYDAGLGRVLLFGGLSGPPIQTPFNDVWAWDGAIWAQLQMPNTPAVRIGPNLAYDPARTRLVLFGGSEASGVLLHDTWELFTPAPASYEPFGTGCAGSAGTPRLSRTPGSRPWVGATFTADVTDLPPGGGAVAMLLGVSNTSWLGLQLPLGLAPLGMPGCHLLVSPDVAIALTSAAGRATWSRWLPTSAALIGRSFHNQAFVADPAANPFGATVSNGATGTIGLR